MPNTVYATGMFMPGRKMRGLARVLMSAALVGGLGVVPVRAQDAPPPATAGQGRVGPAETKSAAPAEAAIPPEAPPAVSEPRAASPAGSEATLGQAAPEAPAASPARNPTSPEAAVKNPHDLTPMGMFLSADPVVKAVMIVLAIASVVTWIILLARGATLVLAKRRMSAALAAIRAADGLADASILVRAGLAARLLLETEEELAKSRGLPSEGIKERALMALQRVEAGAARRMAAGTGVLATIGSIGPFVGLFGTVWGIMGSFIGIANTNTTNLAVVAPGIAEALLATGIGLVAAIPAVVIYNALTRSITGYRAMVGDAVALVMRHLSRDLDRRAYGGKAGLRLAAE